MKKSRKYMLVLSLAIIGLLMCSASGYAGEKKEMGGWELDGDYNKHYKNSERDRLKGYAEGIEEVIPLPGMSPGVALLVKDSDGEKVTVHLGPKWFVDPDGIGVRKGDKVKIKGVWAEIGGKEVFMAAKVKKGEFEEYKVRRTKDGFPFWAMSKEELEKERSGK
ncbi:hypothetical protein DENIS_4810 [Desulfonema ishimotonii]|uniref:Magnetosome protein MamS/MamX domain-containing protein n=1 Tax=Desulfonema ishimotonii TaxID=45657 RepID=A0A401G3J2_9BACT|nr:hypothetical protein [Desulfonema ishimotonii]GBC63812.1 hypothetical protein DENIS_4810 [Desulfonema ishimotonii]